MQNFNWNENLKLEQKKKQNYATMMNKCGYHHHPIVTVTRDSIAHHI